MNKEVIFENRVVRVKDHNGDTKEVNAVDNLDEILIQENVIEVIEKVIYALENSSNSFKKNKLRDLFFIPTPIIGTLSVPTIMTYLNAGSLEGYFNTKFGIMEKDKFLALFIAAFIPVAYHMSKNWYNEYKEDAKCEKGRLLALYHLKTNLVIQNERLDNLKKDSKEIHINENKKYKLDETVIDILSDHINLYYNLGYNIKEYYEYFRINGCIPEEVKKDYNDTGVEIIETYLKNNGAKIKKLGSKK